MTVRNCLFFLTVSLFGASFAIAPRYPGWGLGYLVTSAVLAFGQLWWYRDPRE